MTRRLWVTLLAVVAATALLAAQATHLTTSGTLPATCRVGDVYFKTGSSAGFYTCTASNTWSGPYPASGSGTGDVVGPSSSTDEAVARFDSTTGKLLQNTSTLTLSDAGAFTFADGVKQTFNPNGTNAGINVGSQAGDPSTPANGDLWYDSTANTLDARINGATVQLGAGTSKVVQVVNTQTGAVATGTTTIPTDDSIPQNTEGTEFMTRAITPTSSTNKLKIDIVFMGGHSAGTNQIITVALYQDTTADAIAVVGGTAVPGGNVTISFTHYMDAGTTSSTTFKIRAGTGGASTVTFNGNASGRWFGGVMASSITITEIVP